MGAILNIFIIIILLLGFIGIFIYEVKYGKYLIYKKNKNKHKVTLNSCKESERFIAALQNPPKANEKLKQLFKKHTIK